MHLFSILEALVLVVALSVDAFVASLAYGTNKIKIPFRSVVVISLVCSAMLALSLAVGSLVRPFLPPGLTNLLCFAILFVLGAVKLCDSTIKSIIRKKQQLKKELSFSFLHLSFILCVYANPEQADLDASKTLSPAEAASLALALSLDGLAVGFGAAFSNINPFVSVLFSLLINIFAVVLGCRAGNKIAERSSLNLSWLSGVMLLLIAVTKLF